MYTNIFYKDRLYMAIIYIYSKLSIIICLLLFNSNSFMTFSGALTKILLKFLIYMLTWDLPKINKSKIKSINQKSLKKNNTKNQYKNIASIKY